MVLFIGLLHSSDRSFPLEIDLEYFAGENRRRNFARDFLKKEEKWTKEGGDTFRARRYDCSKVKSFCFVRRHLRSLNGASSYRYVHHDNGIAFHSYQHRSLATAALPRAPSDHFPSLVPSRLGSIATRRIAPESLRRSVQPRRSAFADCERSFNRARSSCWLHLARIPSCNCWKTARWRKLISFAPFFFSYFIIRRFWKLKIFFDLYDFKEIPDSRVRGNERSVNLCNI